MLNYGYKEDTLGRIHGNQKETMDGVEEFQHLMAKYREMNLSRKVYAAPKIKPT